MSIPHLPVLRLGRVYASLDQSPVQDFRNGATLAKVSSVNAGILRRDLQKMQASGQALKKFKVQELLDICKRTGEAFLQGTLPLGDQGHTQSPDQYVETLSATSGMPHVLVRKNMAKIHAALHNMETVLNGLTRGLDLSILDRGYGEQNGARLSYLPMANALGLVMPSNSPAVNSLWLPAIPLKTPVILKPGREEPWTPYRLIQAFIASGCPAEAFGFYPTDHEGAGEILRSCGRALIFGDKATTAQYANNPAIQIHGPGYSKIVIGEDQADRWPEFLDVIAASIVENGGRSCINASAVITPRHADKIAAALAEKLGPISPKAATDASAQLSGFANPKMADFTDGSIEEGLRVPGARDATAEYRNGSRKVLFEGATFLRPTIIHCESFAHPLANREFLFPYASVVQVPQAEMLATIGPSLVVTAITHDKTFIEELMACRQIDRLNIGPIPTMKISWDQPHEGNLFEFLYKRRSLEVQIGS